MLDEYIFGASRAYFFQKRLPSTRKFLSHRPRWSSQCSHIMKSFSSSDDISYMFIKIGFSVIDDMEVKRVYLKTEHGYTFNVKLYNGDVAQAALVFTVFALNEIFFVVRRHFLCSYR